MLATAFIKKIITYKLKPKPFKLNYVKDKIIPESFTTVQAFKKINLIKMICKHVVSTPLQPSVRVRTQFTFIQPKHSLHLNIIQPKHSLHLYIIQPKHSLYLYITQP